MVIAISTSQVYVGHLVPWVFLYIGPEVLLPLTSALAAIVGVVLMFWNKVVGLARGVWQTVSRSKK